MLKLDPQIVCLCEPKLARSFITVIPRKDNPSSSFSKLFLSERGWKEKYCLFEIIKYWVLEALNSTLYLTLQLEIMAMSDLSDYWITVYFKIGKPIRTAEGTVIGKRVYH